MTIANRTACPVCGRQTNVLDFEVAKYDPATNKAAEILEDRVYKVSRKQYYTAYLFGRRG